MAEQEVDDALVKADRWSKVLALLVAMVTYLVAMVLTDNVAFNASVAAFAGVGARIYVPYHASIRGAGGVPSQAMPDTGNYHHGAVGLALIVGSVLALGVMAVEPTYYAAMGAGLAGAAISFLVLRMVLPSE